MGSYRNDAFFIVIVCKFAVNDTETTSKSKLYSIEALFNRSNQKFILERVVKGKIQLSGEKKLRSTRGSFCGILVLLVKTNYFLGWQKINLLAKKG